MREIENPLLSIWVCPLRDWSDGGIGLPLECPRSSDISGRVTMKGRENYWVQCILWELPTCIQDIVIKEEGPKFSSTHYNNEIPLNDWTLMIQSSSARRMSVKWGGVEVRGSCCCSMDFLTFPLCSRISRHPVLFEEGLTNSKLL